MTSTGSESHKIANSSWNSVFWLIGSIFAPLTLPYLIYSLMAQYRYCKNQNSLRGKVVFITGASSGLGEALAHIFYTSGCQVILAARRLEELERVRSDLHDIKSNSTNLLPVVLTLDLSELDSIPNKVAYAESICGPIDILVNNGGVSVRADVLTTSIDVDLKVMLVNYFGSVALTKAILPSMIKRKSGQIVCISSVQGKFSLPHRSSYSASKHALQAFCDSLRAEMAEHNIKVLCVSPGYINTALSLNALTGTGRAYGVTDETTASGESPESIADDIRKAILREENDVTLAPLLPRTVHWIRFLFPNIYFWMMEKRARKMSKKNVNE